MNTKQLLLVIALTTSIEVIAMDNRTYTQQITPFRLAQIRFHINWRLLEATPAYQEYRRADAAHTKYNNEYTAFILNNAEKNLIQTQQSQEFIKSYNTVCVFNAFSSSYTLRARSGSAPTASQKRPKNSILPIGSERSRNNHEKKLLLANTPCC